MSASTHQQPLFSSPVATAPMDTALVRHTRKSILAAVPDSGRACPQFPAVREEDGCGATRRSFNSPWKGPGLFHIQVWSGFEEYGALHALPSAQQLAGWGLGLASESLSCGIVGVLFVCGFFYCLYVIGRTIIIPDLSLETCLTPVFGR